MAPKYKLKSCSSYVAKYRVAPPIIKKNILQHNRTYTQMHPYKSVYVC